MLPLDPEVVDIVALAAAAGALLALLLATVALGRLRRLRRTLATLGAGSDDGSLLSAVERQLLELAAMREQVAGAERRLTEVGEAVSDALRHVAVVRYDAFQDMGGRMSFSAALLDDAGDGIVLTAINGRSETRAYAKGIRGGSSEHTLSPEEQQAIDSALAKVRRGVPAGGRSR